MKGLCISAGLAFFIFIFVTSATCGECPGDLDGNSVVDGSDLAEFTHDYGSTDCPVKSIKYIVCDGSLSAGSRWCNNTDGTVTDMTTGLVWLKDAGWGGQKAWRCDASYAWCATDYDDANARAGILQSGMAGLTDGSEGNWRLPTKSELFGLTSGSEAVSSSSPYWFTGLQPDFYWTSTTNAYGYDYAWYVDMYSLTRNFSGKNINYYVWPVRGED